MASIHDNIKQTLTAPAFLEALDKLDEQQADAFAQHIIAIVEGKPLQTAQVAGDPNQQAQASGDPNEAYRARLQQQAQQMHAANQERWKALTERQNQFGSFLQELVKDKLQTRQAGKPRQEPAAHEQPTAARPDSDAGRSTSDTPNADQQLERVLVEQLTTCYTT